MEEGVRTIYVDLDHTLVRVDLLQERLLVAMVRNPAVLVTALIWFLQGGRERLKLKFASRFGIDAAHLPFNEELIRFLQTRRDAGVELVLATAAPSRWAHAVSEHLGLFVRVLATDGTNGNLKGRRKLTLILQDSGGRPFAYAGDAISDRPIFEAAQLPIVVGAGAELAGRRAESALVIAQRPADAQGWWRSLRPHQWSKNLLIFAPAIAAHQAGALWPNGWLAFMSFCLVASAFYILNDLYDIDLDRHHPEKRTRSLAAGVMDPALALVTTILLLGLAVVISIHLPLKFNVLLLGYAATNALYSNELKKIAVLDLMTLAFLYSIRVFAGGAACGIVVSTWLAVLTFFLALSLAHLKRYVEIANRARYSLTDSARPAYTLEDLPLLVAAGAGVGLISVLVLALYITSPQVYTLYKEPHLLFGICVLHFYWIERIWMLAIRGKMASDPVTFIVTDRVSYFIGGATLLTAWLAGNV